jgi:hypothetical protein
MFNPGNFSGVPMHTKTVKTMTLTFVCLVLLAGCDNIYNLGIGNGFTHLQAIKPGGSDQTHLFMEDGSVWMSDAQNKELMLTGDKIEYKYELALNGAGCMIHDADRGTDAAAALLSSPHRKVDKDYCPAGAADKSQAADTKPEKTQTYTPYMQPVESSIAQIASDGASFSTDDGHAWDVDPGYRSALLKWHVKDVLRAGDVLGCPKMEIRFDNESRFLLRYLQSRRNVDGVWITRDNAALTLVGLQGF